MRTFMIPVVILGCLVAGYTASGDEPDGDVPPDTEFPPPVCSWVDLQSLLLPPAGCGSMGNIVHVNIDDCPCKYALVQDVNIPAGNVGHWQVQVNGATLAGMSTPGNFRFGFSVTLACGDTFELNVWCSVGALPPLSLIERQTGSCTGPCDD